jgi:translation initiation factor 1
VGLQPHGGSLATTDDIPADPLDAIRIDGSRLYITVEARRYGKPMTIVDGFPHAVDVDAIARRLKRQVGAGGGAKNGRLELQGDQRQRIQPLLRRMGFQVD